MSRWKSVVHVLQWVVIGFGLISLYTRYLAVREWKQLAPDWQDKIVDQLDRPYIERITAVQPDIQRFVGMTLLGITASGLVLAVLGLAFGAGSTWSGLLCLVTAIAMPISGCVGVLSNLAPWQ